MTDITREEFPREFPIFPKETTTPRLTDIEPDQETVVPDMQETSSKVSNVPSVINNLWQYRLWRYKIRKVFRLKINCSPMKLLNFKNWSNGELSKIGHHFRKNFNTKKCAP